MFTVWGHVIYNILSLFQNHQKHTAEQKKKNKSEFAINILSHLSNSLLTAIPTVRIIRAVEGIPNTEEKNDWKVLDPQ